MYHNKLIIIYTKIILSYKSIWICNIGFIIYEDNIISLLQVNLKA